MGTKGYTPALGYDWVSIWYDLAIKLTMPERKFRIRLIDQVKLPEYMQASGFYDVSESSYVNTKIGSFCYNSGIKT